MPLVEHGNPQAPVIAHADLVAVPLHPNDDVPMPDHEKGPRMDDTHCLAMTVKKYEPGCGGQARICAARSASLNNLIGASQYRIGNRETETASRFLVDNELECRRLLNRQIAGVDALQDPGDVLCGISHILREARSIRHQSAGIDVVPRDRDGRHPMRRGKINDAVPIYHVHRSSDHKQAVQPVADNFSKNTVEVLRSTYIKRTDRDTNPWRDILDMPQHGYADRIRRSTAPRPI
jgi:hypothetical protein